MDVERPETEFRVLGPLRVFSNGVEVEVNAPMQRRLLLRLLLDRNQAVSRDRLQHALWPDAESDKGSALGFHMSKLRDLVDPDRTDLIATEGSGYVVRVADDQIDSARFARLIDRAAGAVESNPAVALRDIDDALSQWTGTPLADAEFDDFARTEIERLEHLRVWALELRMRGLLGLGRSEEAAVELDRLVSEHPLNEKLRGLQMTALYRSGRQAEALRAYKAAHDVLGEELGIEPSPELTELEEKILFGEKELLEAPSASAPIVNTVPAPVSEFIGRRTELSDVIEMAGRARLVTLVGQGGIGKTRLAQAVAEEMALGFEAIWWVSLADLGLDSEVAPEVASAVGLGDRADSAPVDSIVDHLARRRTLLIVDNCEHVVDGVRDIVDPLLARAPGTTIITTSRRSLQAQGEAVYRLPRLEVPEPEASAKEIEKTAAIEFMLRSAELRGIHPEPLDIDSLASITRRLEGVPLAIELAVARLNSLTPGQLDERLAQNRSALVSAGPTESEHRRSLAATIEWSVSLLSGEAQELFVRLGVFYGGADLAAVEAVCTEPPLGASNLIEALEELVDASLVERTIRADRPRFLMLDSVAEVSRSRLTRQDPSGRTAESHARYFAVVSLNGYSELVGLEQTEALARLKADESNLRTALLWGWEYDPELAAAIALGLGRYLARVGKFALARRTLGELIDTADLPPTSSTASLLGLLANLSIVTGEMDRARVHATRQSSIVATTDDFAATVFAHYVESNVLWAEGRTRDSHELLAEALAEIGERTDPTAVYMLRDQGRRSVQLGASPDVDAIVADLEWWSERGHPAGTVFALEIRGARSFYDGDIKNAEVQLTEAVSSLRDLGARLDLAESLNWQSYVFMATRQWDRATTSAIEAQELASAALTPGLRAQSLSIIGNALLRTGRVDAARRNLVTAVELALRAHALIDLVLTTSFLAAYNTAVGDWERAVVLYAAAEKAGADMGLVTPVTFGAYRENDLGELRDMVGEERFVELQEFGADLQLGPDLLDYVSMEKLKN